MYISYFYNLLLPSPHAALIQILHTCRALCERGVTVTVYTGPLRCSDVSECLTSYGLTPHPLLRIEPFYEVQRKESLRRKLARTLPQIQNGRHYIISRGEPGLALFQVLARLQRSPGQKHVYESHRPCVTTLPRSASTSLLRLPEYLSYYVKQARIYAIERAMLARLDGLICLTRGVYDALQDIFGLSLSLPTLILPSGTALPARNLPDDTERDLDIVYAGKIIRRKGVYDLVEALQYLPGYRLCILGGAKGQLKELIAFAAERGVMSQITFTGHVEPATVCEYWMRAKVGVCPLPLGESDISERYTSPLKVLEMMAYGVPIVATSVPTLADLLKPGETAQFARPSDPHSLAEAIRMLLENRVLARQLAANAHLEVKAYSWDQRARRLHEFLLHQELFNHSMSSEAPKRTV